MTVRLDTMVIKKAMAKKRMTTASLARLCGMAPQNASTILTRGTCSHINAARLADALGMEYDDLLKGE